MTLPQSSQLLLIASKITSILVLHWRMTMIMAPVHAKPIPLTTCRSPQMCTVFQIPQLCSHCSLCLKYPHPSTSFLGILVNTHPSFKTHTSICAMMLLLTASCHTVDHGLLLSPTWTWQMISIVAKMNSICFLISKSLQSSFNQKSYYITGTSKPKRNFQGMKKWVLCNFNTQLSGPFLEAFLWLPSSELCVHVYALSVSYI